MWGDCYDLIANNGGDEDVVLGADASLRHAGFDRVVAADLEYVDAGSQFDDVVLTVWYANDAQKCGQLVATGTTDGIRQAFDDAEVSEAPCPSPEDDSLSCG